jgi:hypothetical protein
VRDDAADAEQAAHVPEDDGVAGGIARGGLAGEIDVRGDDAVEVALRRKREMLDERFSPTILWTSLFWGRRLTKPMTKPRVTPRL